MGLVCQTGTSWRSKRSTRVIDASAGPRSRRQQRTGVADVVGGPKRVRTKEERQDGALVIVQAGNQWWIREPDGKGHTNEGDPIIVVGFGPWPETPAPAIAAGVYRARLPTRGG